MKKNWIIALLFLSSCSLLQRHDEEAEPNSLDEMEAQQSHNAPPLESEVARLNTKISALETKLDVLSSNVERMQLKNAQPVIEAEASQSNIEPQNNMAAPVEMEEPAQISSAPKRPQDLPTETKSIAPSNNVEKEFRLAMEFFQNGKLTDAAARFSIIAKKYPGHLLASHALYWAGESNARNKQWSIAVENWGELEKNYPRSAYLPEALSGLANAYTALGNISKAHAYRDTLMRSFPKSPIAMNQSSAYTNTPERENSSSGEEPSAPIYEENNSTEAEE